MWAALTALATPLAEELGCSQTTLASYFRQFGQEPGAPQLRTNGKL